VQHLVKFKCRFSWQAQHLVKSKCHFSWQVQRSAKFKQNCTPLWREARSEVKMLKKKEGLGALFEVLMSKNCTPLWRSAHLEVKIFKKLSFSEPFLKF